MKHSLRLIFVTLLLLMGGSAARAQYVADKLAIHLSSPLGLLSKGGAKLEYRLYEQSALLAGYTNYWGFFPGYNAAIEYRRYYQTWGRAENFIYFKAGGGTAQYRPKPYYNSWQDAYSDPGKYLFAGAGVGRRYHWGPFFIEVNLGLKAAQLVNAPENYNSSLFYTSGPGSIVDCNFQFGLQFLGHKGSVSHITGTQRYRRYRY